jgi:hypothetical protein
MTEKRTGEIRLYTDQDGRIWGQGRGEEPRDLGTDPDGLVAQSWIQDADKIRLLAGSYNAALITALHSSRCSVKKPRSVLLGNPDLVPDPQKRLSAIFGRMDGWEMSPSLGGWRELTDKDYVTYALVGVLQKSSGKLNNLAERLLRAHPAWPAVSFLSDTNLEAVCQLICQILDPRWHVDPAKPDARKRLLSRLGLGHSGLTNIEAILEDDDDKAGPRCDVARLVLDAWTGGDYVQPEAIDAHSFLWRIAQGQPGAKGLLAASKVFLTFLHDVWLDNLTPMRQYEPVTKKLGVKRPTSVNYLRMVKAKCYSPQLFVPEHFFGSALELKAWRSHTERLRQRA